MAVYVYCLKEDYKHLSSIKGREFENEWFKLSKDGMVIVKGTHYKGYACRHPSVSERRVSRLLREWVQSEV